MRFLFLNGSVRGERSNTATLLRHAAERLPPHSELEQITLTTFAGTVRELAESLLRADALLLATGVYWGSWGSPLQRFLEVITSYELSPCFLGKPAGVLVNMDSVGGSDVAQRLQGTLNLLGCVLPPLSSVVLSRTGLALAGQPGFEDVFQLNDLTVALANLALCAEQPRPSWRTWSIERVAQLDGAFPHSGVLDIGLERL